MVLRFQMLPGRSWASYKKVPVQIMLLESGLAGRVESQQP